TLMQVPGSSPAASGPSSGEPPTSPSRPGEIASARVRSRIRGLRRARHGIHQAVSVLPQEQDRPIYLRRDLDLVVFHVTENATQDMRQVNAAGAWICDQLEIHRSRADIVIADAPFGLLALTAVMMRYGRSGKIAAGPALRADP